MSHTDLASPLLAWYKRAARDLPWRNNLDPYVVWISEIMLQQTRVDTVIPFFTRWMERFPGVADLAQASLQDVLVVWEGLGYYGRARNLHQAAQIILEQYGGRLPEDVTQLKKLPGIGRYTAGAIASIAYGKNVPAVDGNARRVLSRIFNIHEPLLSPTSENRLWSLAAEYLPADKAGDFNQALMDLGAQICTPRKPLCDVCPAAQICQAKLLGIQEEIPVRLKKPAVPHHIVAAAVIQNGGRVLIAQRPADGLLGGLWEFPGGKMQPGEDLMACLEREIMEELSANIVVGAPLGVYRHAYTHFRVTLHAYFCKLANHSQPRATQVEDLRWVAISELFDFPMGKIDRLISKDLQGLRFSAAKN